MIEPNAVAPAFRSTRQAAVFCAAVLGLLALPAIFTALGLYNRRDAYLEMPIGDGGLAYIEKQGLEERSDIDLLLVGDSLLWLGVDTVYIQNELERAEGRPVNVMMFAHNARGLDLDYGMIRDVLARRRVKTLVLASSPPWNHQEGPHHYAYHFLPYSEDPALSEGVSLQNRLIFYAASVLGAPRHLLSLLRRNPDYDHWVRPMRGSHLVPEGFYGAPYEPLDRDPPAVPTETLIGSAASAPAFAFTEPPFSPYQEHFARLIVDMARAHGTRLVTFRIPRWSDRASPVAAERADWPRVFGADTTIVGVAPAVLFGGLNEDEIKRLYTNEHFNASGATRFTRTITPALLEIYHRALP
jgi:hypothetical protein